MKSVLPKRPAFLLVWLTAVLAVFFASPSVWAEDDADDIQDDIKGIEKRLEKETAKKNAIVNELNSINYSITMTQKLINETQSHIEETEEEIKRKKNEIAMLESEIDRNKRALRDILVEAYYDSGALPLGILPEEDFFRVLNNPDQFRTVGERIRDAVERIQEAYAVVADEKEQLEDAKEDKEKLLDIKEREKYELVLDQQETKSDLQKQEETIAQLRSKLNSLRNEYSRLLGKAVSTDDILKAAKFAANATGMSKAFLLGVLIQESNKGRNVGSCDYKESKMSSAQLTALKKIADELDYNYKKLKFSCPPKSYNGTGGAMGVAQFMPTTWLGYKSRIASLTGSNPPDPWDLVDGVTAMAIKLSNDGASKKDRFSEAKSYCVYLAGGNWGYYCYGSASKYKKSYKNVNCWGSSIKNYGEKVLCLKDNYEQFYD